MVLFVLCCPFTCLTGDWPASTASLCANRIGTYHVIRTCRACDYTSQLGTVLCHHAFEKSGLFRTMTANILSAELTALALESKRKLPELRTVCHTQLRTLLNDDAVTNLSFKAADQSLQELKSLPSTSEAQLGGGMPNLLPFLKSTRMISPSLN